MNGELNDIKRSIIRQSGRDARYLSRLFGITVAEVMAIQSGRPF
jgi:hypothetical protein